MKAKILCSNDLDMLESDIQIYMSMGFKISGQIFINKSNSLYCILMVKE